MADESVKANRRAGRETELRKKLRDVVDRYETVFGKPLTTVVLKEFLDESEKHNRYIFLRDRVGVLEGADIAFLRNVLKENVNNDVTPVKTSVTDEDVDLDIPDIEEDGEESFV